MFWAWVFFRLIWRYLIALISDLRISGGSLDRRQKPGDGLIRIPESIGLNIGMIYWLRLSSILIMLII
jgi:hypothetical protein